MLRNSVEIIEHDCENWSPIRSANELKEKLSEMIGRRNPTGDRIISITPITSYNGEVSYTSGFIIIFEYETED